MKHINTIEMNIAIVPNRATNMVNNMYKGVAEMQRKSLDGYKRRFGLKAEPEDLAVEIWYGSEQESYQNGGLPVEFDTMFPAEGLHGNHGFQWDKYGNRIDILPAKLPAKMFLTAKEGDKVLLFENDHTKVYGICNQKANRYAWAGNFEDAFEKVYR